MSTPSPGYWPPEGKKLDWGMYLYLIRPDLLTELLDIKRALKTIDGRLDAMGEQTSAAVAELKKDVQRLADGYVALQGRAGALENENGQLRSALEQADADKAAAIASARAEEDSAAAAAIAEADAIVEGASPEPAPEPTP